MAKYTADRRRDLSGPTELRVHGVGGTPPEDLLGHDVILVAGSEESGFYKVAPSELATSPLEGDLALDPHKKSLEAYSWGGLTSGGPFLQGLAKSLWVVLLPQAMLNTAGWMLPAVRGQEDVHPGEGALRHRWVRLAALWSTIVFGLFLGMLAVDLVMLQCGGQPACVDGHSWLKWLRAGLLGRPMLFPGRLVVLGLIVPVAGLTIAWFIGRRSQRNSEGDETAAPLTAAQTGEGATGAALAREDLWQSPRRVGSLTRIHLVAGGAAVALATAFTLWKLHDLYDPGTGAWYVLLGAAAGALLAIAIWLGLRGGPQSRQLTWGLLYATIALLAAVAVVGWVDSPRRDPIGDHAASVAELSRDAQQELRAAGRPDLAVAVERVAARVELEPARASDDARALPAASPALADLQAELSALAGDDAAAAALRLELGGYFTWAGLAIGVAPMIAFLAVYFFIVLFARYDRAASDYTRLGSWGLVGLAVVIGGAFFTGAALWLADWLDRASPEKEACDLCATAYEISLRDFYLAAAVAVMIVLASALVLALLGVLRLWRASKRNLPDAELWDDLVAAGELARARERFPHLYGTLTDGQMKQKWDAIHDKPKWLARIRRERLIATHYRSRATTIGVVASAVATAFGIWAIVDLVVHAGDGSAGFESTLSGWSWLATFAKWALAAAFVWLLNAVRKSYGDPEYRRGLAKLWDVLTFWPRWFHPLAPPSYVGTAAPQLRGHLEAHHGRPGDQVVLAAHSQGAILAIATVARLSGNVRQRLALLTYGNPLRPLYSWFFPRFFGRAEMDIIADALRPARGAPPRWRNLARCTDAIGGAPIRTTTFGCVPEGFTGPRLPDGSRRLNEVDRIVPDPFPEWPAPGDPMPPMKGHSYYEEQAPYRTAVCELFGSLGVGADEVGCPAPGGSAPTA